MIIETTVSVVNVCIEVIRNRSLFTVPWSKDRKSNLKTFIVVALIVAIYTVTDAIGWPTSGIKKRH